MRMAYGERGPGRSRDGPAVHQHLLHHHFACVFHAQRDHGEAVADEDHIHARVVSDEGAGEVVGGYHGDGLVLAVQRLQGLDGDLLALTRRCGA